MIVPRWLWWVLVAVCGVAAAAVGLMVVLPTARRRSQELPHQVSDEARDVARIDAELERVDAELVHVMEMDDAGDQAEELARMYGAGYP